MSAKGYTLDKVRQGIITVFTDDSSGLRTIDYKGTGVVTELKSHLIQLNTNGWLTPTSKKVMNRYFDLQRLPLKVHQEKKVWYVKNLNNGAILEYYDGIKLPISHR